MARHLQESGNDMTVHDLRREAATPFLEYGAERAGVEIHADMDSE